MSNLENKRDGIDYINVSMDGKTELGRMLSMEYTRPFKCPRTGHVFRNLHQYWIWLQSGKNDDVFNLPGWDTNPELAVNLKYSIDPLPGIRSEMVTCINEVIGSNVGIVNSIKDKLDKGMVFIESRSFRGSDGKIQHFDSTRPWFIKAIVDMACGE